MKTPKVNNIFSVTSLNFLCLEMKSSDFVVYTSSLGTLQLHKRRDRETDCLQTVEHRRHLNQLIVWRASASCTQIAQSIIYIT